MNDKDAVKAGAFTALWTFIAFFGLSLVGWLGDVLTWANSSDVAVAFPDASPLAKASVAAAAAAASGLVGTIVRLAQVHLGSGGGGPKYSD